MARSDGLDTLPTGELRKTIAIPFKAKDEPAVRSEFSHPDIMIGFTLLSYLYQGLNIEQLTRCLNRLYQTCRAFSEILCQWDSFFNGQTNLSIDTALKRSESLCINRQAIFFYCNHFVFPEGTKQFTIKISGNAETLIRNAIMQGFSGTEGRKKLMPLRTVSQPYDKQANGKMMHIAMRSVNKTIKIASYDATEQLLDKFKDYINDINNPSAQNQNSPLGLNDVRCCVLIDAGALITGLNNKAVASYLLEKLPHSSSQDRVENTEFLGVIYFDETLKRLSVVLRSGHTIALNQCQISNKHLFTYLDNARARGTDTKLYSNAHAIVTIDQGIDKDTFMQAIMRMRQLNEQQTFSVWMHPSVARKIGDVNAIHYQRIENKHVLAWISINAINHIKKQLRPHCLQARAAIVKYCALESQQHYMPDKLASINPEALEQCVHPIDTRLSTFYSILSEPKNAHAYATHELIPEANFGFITDPDKEALSKIRQHFQSVYTERDEISVMTIVRTASTVNVESLPSFEQDQEQEQQMEVIQRVIVPRPIEKQPLAEKNWSYVSLFGNNGFARKAIDGQIRDLGVIQLEKFTRSVNLKSGSAATLMLSDLTLGNERIWLTENFLYSVSTNPNEIIDYLRPVNLLILERERTGSHYWILVSGAEGNGIKNYLFDNLRQEWPNNICCFHLHDKWDDQGNIFSSFTGLRYTLSATEKMEYIILKLFNGDCEYLPQHQDTLRIALGRINDEAIQTALNTILAQRQINWDGTKRDKYREGFKFALIEQDYMTKNGFLTENSTRLFRPDGNFDASNIERGTFNDHLTVAFAENTRSTENLTEGRCIITRLQPEEMPDATVSTLFGLSTEEATNRLIENRSICSRVWGITDRDGQLRQYLTNKARMPIDQLDDNLNTVYVLAMCCKITVVIWETRGQAQHIRQKDTPEFVNEIDDSQRIDMLVENTKIIGLLNFIGYDNYPEPGTEILPEDDEGRSRSLSLYRHNVQYNAIDNRAFELSTALFKEIAESVIGQSIFTTTRSRAHLAEHYIYGWLTARDTMNTYIGSSLEKVINPYVSSEFIIDVDEENNLLRELEEQQHMLPYEVAAQNARHDMASLPAHDIGMSRIEKLHVIINQFDQAKEFDSRNKKNYPQKIIQLRQAVNRLKIGNAALTLADEAIRTLEREIRQKNEEIIGSRDPQARLTIYYQIKQLYEKAISHDPCNRHASLRSSRDEVKQTISSQKEALVSGIARRINEQCNRAIPKTVESYRIFIAHLNSFINQITSVDSLFERDSADTNTQARETLQRHRDEISSRLSSSETKIQTYQAQDARIEPKLEKIQEINQQINDEENKKHKIDKLTEIINLLQEIKDIDDDQRYNEHTWQLPDVNEQRQQLINSILESIDSELEENLKNNNLLLDSDNLSHFYDRFDTVIDGASITNLSLTTNSTNLSDQQKNFIIRLLKLIRPQTEAQQASPRSWYPGISKFLDLDENTLISTIEKLQSIDHYDSERTTIITKKNKLTWLQTNIRLLQDLSQRQNSDDIRQLIARANKGLVSARRAIELHVGLSPYIDTLDRIYNSLQEAFLYRAQLCYAKGISYSMSEITKFKRSYAMRYIDEANTNMQMQAQLVQQRDSANFLDCLERQRELVSESIRKLEIAKRFIGNNHDLVDLVSRCSEKIDDQKQTLGVFDISIEIHRDINGNIVSLNSIYENFYLGNYFSVEDLKAKVDLLVESNRLIENIIAKGESIYNELIVRIKEQQNEKFEMVIIKIRIGKISKRENADQASSEMKQIKHLSEALSYLELEYLLSKEFNDTLHNLSLLGQEQEMIQNKINEIGFAGIIRFKEMSSDSLVNGKIDNAIIYLEDALAIAREIVNSELISQLEIKLNRMQEQVAEETATRERETLLQRERDVVEEKKRAAAEVVEQAATAESNIDKLRQLNEAVTLLREASVADTQQQHQTGLSREITVIERQLADLHLQLQANGRPVPMTTVQGHRLELNEQIGSGGFGDVYRGTYQIGDNPPIVIAVKLFRIQNLRQRDVSSFNQEATTMADLRHGNIVEYKDHVAAQPTYALVMELMPDGSLYDAFQTSVAFTYTQRMDIAKDATRGLEYLHSRGIIHRDLKSLNLLLKHSGQRYTAKWSDFGLSKMQDSVTRSTSSHRSRQGQQEAPEHVGTLRWTAPEILRDPMTPQDGKYSDIWSLGMTLWEIYSEEIPFYRINHDAAVEREIRTHGADRMSRECIASPNVAELVGLCWNHRNPSDRPKARYAMQILETPPEPQAPNRANILTS